MILQAQAVAPATAGGTTCRFTIRGLRARCVIGTQDWERKRRQKVLLEIAFEADATEAVRRDEIGATVDYKAIKQRVVEYVRNSEHQLLEKLAAAVAEVVLADRRVRSVEVTVDKPGALSGATSVAATVGRRR